MLPNTENRLDFSEAQAIVQYRAQKESVSVVSPRYCVMKGVRCLSTNIKSTLVRRQVQLHLSCKLTRDISHAQHLGREDNRKHKRNTRSLRRDRAFPANRALVGSFH